MQALSTKRLLAALQAGFQRCQEHGQPLSADQQTLMFEAVFDAFADTIIAEHRKETR